MVARERCNPGCLEASDAGAHHNHAAGDRVGDGQYSPFDAADARVIHASDGLMVEIIVLNTRCMKCNSECRGRGCSWLLQMVV